ncbi:MAG: glycosyltransferase family 2 protein [Patescibacteria group bacterium]
MKRAVVVIPTYNESKNIEQMIREVTEAGNKVPNWNISILVVDSKSPDKTADVIKSIQKKNKKLYLLETEKEGLGKAYLRGFEYALQDLQADVVFEIDADLSHSPKEIPKFIAEIEKGADMVVGTRYSKGGSIPSDWGLHRKILSVVANWIVRLGFMKFTPSDWTGGYRAVRSWVVKQVTPTMQEKTGYVFQVAFLDRAIKRKARVTEVPIHFTDRVEGVSKINAPQYVVQTLWYVFTNSSFVKFVIVGGSGAVLDFGIAYALKTYANLDVKWANGISAETAVIFNFLVNNFWSFRHSKLEGGIFTYLWNFLKFNLVSLGNIAIQLVGISIGVHFFGEKYWLFYKAFTIGFVVIPYSYILYNKVIWKK